MDAPFTIFIVEDNDWYNKLLVHNLSLNPDFVVRSFFNAKDFLKEISKNPDVVTVDYRLPDMDGEALLKKIKDFNPEIEVIVISEQSEIETAVDLLKAGAYDYLVKTKDIRDRLLNTINNIRKNEGLKKRISSLEKEVQVKYSFQKTIIGKSSSLEKVSELMNKAVATNITVSITGETGTGKEVVAKAIHYNSDRKDAPFIAVNMAAIPSELIESELFGHEKGAFTGAIARRKGKFEEAENGTLFLDEIGEMDLAFQVKLLRVLQEKEITRIGSNVPVKTNCRIIVATNKNLQEEVRAGKFREDLFFRLFGLPIHLPPLRERGEDILILAKYFIGLFCEENNLEMKELSEESRNKLMTYHWPGNVRELKSVVELATVMSNHLTIEPKDITFTSNSTVPEIISEEMTMREYSRRIVNVYMQKCNNNTKEVAEKLGIGQTTVYRLLKEDMS